MIDIINPETIPEVNCGNTTFLKAPNGEHPGLEQLHITEDPSALGEGSQIDIQTGCKGIQADHKRNITCFIHLKKYDQ